MHFSVALCRLSCVQLFVDIISDIEPADIAADAAPDGDARIADAALDDGVGCGVQRHGDGGGDAALTPGARGVGVKPVGIGAGVPPAAGASLLTPRCKSETQSGGAEGQRARGNDRRATRRDSRA